jgi:hypothetical protein
MGRDGIEQVRVTGGIGPVDTAGEDRDGQALGGQGAAVGAAVDPERPAGRRCINTGT